MDIQGREYIFGTLVKNRRDTYNQDAVIVKEHLHLADGTIKHNLRIIENYQRDFYVTRPQYQNHEQKKEWEWINRCDKYTTNTATLVSKASKVLNLWGARTITQVNQSQYIYGTDISTTTLVASEYKQKWGQYQSFAEVGVWDYETDVLGRFEHDKAPVCVGFTYKEKAILVVRRELFLNANFPNDDTVLEVELRGVLQEHLGELLKKRNVDLEIVLVDNGLDLVKRVFARMHEWQPDFIGVWNLPFEAEVTELVCKYYDHSLAELYSDPKIPKQFHHYNYRQGDPKKEKADGQSMTIHLQDLWHTLDSAAGFKMISADCLYKHLRVRDGNRNSYGLDSVLEDEIGQGKLRFSKADGLEGLEWHEFMQERYPMEYCAYNLFDCFGIEIMDENTKDMANALRANVGLTDLNRIKSIPKKRADDFHFRLFKQGKIIGSTNENMSDELDKLTPNTRNWIIALPAELEWEMGIKAIKEYPNLMTNVTTHAYDSDVKSCYPTAGSVLNTGKTTTRLEVCHPMVGKNELITREWGIDYTCPEVNALNLARVGYKFPSNDVLLDAYLKQRGNVS